MRLKRLRFLLRLTDNNILISSNRLGANSTNRIFPDLAAGKNNRTNIIEAANNSPTLGDNLRTQLQLPSNTNTQGLLRKTLQLGSISSIRRRTRTFTGIKRKSRSDILNKLTKRSRTSQINLTTSTRQISLRLQLNSNTSKQKGLRRIKTRIRLIALNRIMKMILRRKNTALGTMTRSNTSTRRSNNLPITFDKRTPTMLKQRTLQTGTQRLQRDTRILRIISTNNTTINTRRISRHNLFLNNSRRKIMLNIRRDQISIMLNLMILSSLLSLIILSNIMHDSRLISNPDISKNTRRTLNLNLITLNSNSIARIITPTRSLRIIKNVPTNTNTNPNTRLLNSLEVNMITSSGLTLSTRTKSSMARLAITINNLIRIRRIRISNLPQSFLIILNNRLRRQLNRRFRTTGPRLNQKRNITPNSSTSSIQINKDLSRRLLSAIKKLRNKLRSSLNQGLTNIIRMISRFDKIGNSLTRNFFTMRILQAGTRPSFLTLRKIFRGREIASFASLFVKIYLDFVHQPELPSREKTGAPPY